MNLIGFSLLFLSFALPSTATDQERTAHGLAYENTVAFPPSAYYFFHPNERKPENKDPCIASKCSPLPLASHVEATQIYENKASAQQKGGKLIGAGAMIGIIFVVAFAVLVAMGVYYVKVTREANISRASSSVQSHA
uniref:Transmembrane protein n=1 Tax=Lotus japonicus TaxID=34305 RepID=I3S3S1_LOTJA|nr:unknown [Lotus japonicus]